MLIGLVFARCSSVALKGIAALGAAALLGGCNLDSSSVGSPIAAVTAGAGASPSVPTAATPTPTVQGWAALSWDTPLQNDDGSPLTDLAGFRIYYGTSATNLSQVAQINQPSATSFTVNDLNAGTWYFALTAVNSQGVESQRSGVASKAVI
jgi:hypothetical protein